MYFHNEVRMYALTSVDAQWQQDSKDLSCVANTFWISATP